jgi:hypothetical protein
MLAIVFIVGCAVVVWIDKFENARVDRQSSTWDRFANFFRDLKKPRKQRKFRYPEFKKKSVGSEFRALG